MTKLSELKARRAEMRADQHHDRYTNAVTAVLEATDDLIEITEAAMAVIESDADLSRARTDGMSRVQAAMRATESYDKLRAALAKVQP